jgi:hypothetical protein
VRPARAAHLRIRVPRNVLRTHASVEFLTTHIGIDADSFRLVVSSVVKVRAGKPRYAETAAIRSLAVALGEAPPTYAEAKRNFSTAWDYHRWLDRAAEAALANPGAWTRLRPAIEAAAREAGLPGPRLPSGADIVFELVRLHTTKLEPNA